MAEIQIYQTDEKTHLLFADSNGERQSIYLDGELKLALFLALLHRETDQNSIDDPLFDPLKLDSTHFGIAIDAQGIFRLILGSNETKALQFRISEEMARAISNDLREVFEIPANDRMAIAKNIN